MPRIPLFVACATGPQLIPGRWPKFSVSGQNSQPWPIYGLGVVEDIRPGEVDVRAGQVDFHVDVVRRRGRVDVNDRFIMRVVHEPADAVGLDRIGRSDLALDVGQSQNLRKIDVIRVVREIGDRVGLTVAWRRIRGGFEYESIVAAAAGQNAAGRCVNRVIAGREGAV